MRNIIKALGLDEDEIDIYIKCFDKRPLTFSEIHSFKPDFSKDRISNILENLINYNLFVRIESRRSEFLTHYYALPPFKAIEDILKNLKGEQIESKVETTKISDQLRELKSNLENDIEKTRTQIIQSLQERDLSQENLEFLEQFQDNIKKLFAVQINNFLTLIKKFAEQKKIETTEVSTFQEFTTEKIQETNSIIDRMFEELDEIINEYAIEYVDNQLSEDSLFLQTVKDSIISNLTKFLKKEDNTNVEGLDFVIDSLQQYIKSTNLKTDIFNEKVWLINTKTKFFEELSDILKNNNNKIVLILPNLVEEFVKKIKENEIEFKGNTIRLVSSEKHNYQPIKSLQENIKSLNYKQLINNELIGIKGENRVVLGILMDKNPPESNDFVGIGTNYHPFYEPLANLIEERWDKAKPDIKEQIANGFNDIIININKYSGRKIGEQLEDIMDIAFQKEGISLKLLELRILLSTLKNIYSPLDYELKEKVINTIHKLNNEFTSLQLKEPPELESYPFDSEEDNKKYQQKLEEKLNLEEIEPIDYERIEHLFDLFIEKMSDLKGTQISDQISKMINLILQLQGFSDIIKWKNELETVDDFLDEPFQEEVIKDFLRWKKFILEPSERTQSNKKEEIKDEVKSQAQIMDEQQEKIHQAQQTKSTDISVDQPESENTEEDTEFSLENKFLNLKEKSTELPGTELSSLLQEIADVLLLSKGAMAIRDMRNYISKLRSIRDPLEDEIRTQFVDKLDDWIKKFG